WIEDARRIVILTGAGISTESGIPDFRGPQGVWTKDPQAEKLSNIHYYVADPEIRRKSWRARLAHPAWTARPNAGHAAIVELDRPGARARGDRPRDAVCRRGGPASLHRHEPAGLSDRGRGAGREARGRARGDRERRADAVRRHRRRGAAGLDRRDAAAHRRNVRRPARLTAVRYGRTRDAMSAPLNSRVIVPPA